MSAKKKRVPGRKKTTDAPTTEQKILKAARLEFCEKGLEGARMQAIADQAGTNKALLHYYFRSKEKLFEAALKEIISGLWADVRRHLDAHQSETDLRTLIHAIVSAYITTFAAQPAVPKMIIREIAAGSTAFFDAIGEFISSFSMVPDTIFSIYYKELHRGTIKRIEPIHFMMNLMGMCITTFIVKPIAEHVALRTGNSVAFDSRFYEKRIAAITEMACDGIFQQEGRP
jgi:TetR/AcrR family transcriptional regulator